MTLSTLTVKIAEKIWSDVLFCVDPPATTCELAEAMCGSVVADELASPRRLPSLQDCPASDDGRSNFRGPRHTDTEQGG